MTNVNKDAEQKNPLKKRAIAIKGKNNTSSNAQIIAKGQGHLAERILDIAFKHSIKVRQDTALTDILDAYNVDSPIPLEALNSVSLILEYVYKANALEARRKNNRIEDTLETSAKMDQILNASARKLNNDERK